MLKKITVFILLLTLAFRPLYFVGNVLYYELNIDYIIKTYCVNTDKPELHCNGKCHLAKQLQLIDNSSQNNQSSFNVVYEAFYPLYFQIDAYQQIEQVYFLDTSVQNWSYLSSLKDAFLYNCFQPPEQIA